jgi:outer membrane protein OmpA-like peptidoglycan-associated protein
MLIMNKLLKRSAVYALYFLSVTALILPFTSLAQSGESVTSFGNRVPSLDELKTAFAPPPRSKNLMTMGVQPPVRKAIDMNLTFATGSAILTPQAKTQLSVLGEFLASAELGAGEFVVDGHTDAVGSPAANKLLSEKRAEAVRQHLVQQHKIAPQVIKTNGLGSSQLKDASKGTSEVNRRVEFSMLVQP